MFCLSNRKMKFAHHVIFDEDVFPYKLGVPRSYNLSFDSDGNDVVLVILMTLYLRLRMYLKYYQILM